MKKVNIIIIVVIAIAIAAIIGSISDASTYANFEEAFNKPSKEFHVVGVLNRNKEQVYAPEVDPNVFTFYMYDADSVEKKVVLQQSKPQDFDKSDQIVLIGRANADNDVFVASSILLKCPSKYEDGSPQLEHNAQNASI